MDANEILDELEAHGAAISPTASGVSVKGKIPHRLILQIQADPGSLRYALAKRTEEAPSAAIVNPLLPRRQEITLLCAGPDHSAGVQPILKFFPGATVVPNSSDDELSDARRRYGEGDGLYLERIRRPEPRPINAVVWVAETGEDLARMGKLIEDSGFPWILVDEIATLDQTPSADDILQKPRDWLLKIRRGVMPPQLRRSEGS